MATEKNLVKLEKEIRTKMIQIKTGKITPKESGIGKEINLMKSLDEPLFNKIMSEYKKIISKVNAK